MLGHKPQSAVNIFNAFRERFAAGVMITIGCIINLAMISYGSRIGGAFFFAVGLLTIVMYKMVLFTGICGYAFDRRPFHKKTIQNLIGTWGFNMAGCACFGILMLKGISSDYLSIANDMMLIKMKEPVHSLITKGVYCGMLMHLAVLTSKRDCHTVAKIVIVFLCVATFILCRFEHSIANMGYLFLSDINVIKGIIHCIIPVTIGNVLGGVFMNFILGYNPDC